MGGFEPCPYGRKAWHRRSDANVHSGSIKSDGRAGLSRLGCLLDSVEPPVPGGRQLGEPPSRGSEGGWAGRIQHFSARPNPCDQARDLEDLQVLDHCLPGHRQTAGESRGAGPADVDQSVQELSARRVGEGGQDHPDILGAGPQLRILDHLRAQGRSAATRRLGVALGVAKLLLPTLDVVLDGRPAALGRDGQGGKATLDDPQQRPAALLGQEELHERGCTSPSLVIVRLAGSPSPIHHPGSLTRRYTRSMGASIRISRSIRSPLCPALVLRDRPPPSFVSATCYQRVAR